MECEFFVGSAVLFIYTYMAVRGRFLWWICCKSQLAMLRRVCWICAHEYGIWMCKCSIHNHGIWFYKCSVHEHGIWMYMCSVHEHGIWLYMCSIHNHGILMYKCSSFCAEDCRALYLHVFFLHPRIKKMPRWILHHPCTLKIYFYPLPAGKVMLNVQDVYCGRIDLCP